jgi:hypothetical protein
MNLDRDLLRVVLRVPAGAADGFPACFQLTANVLWRD